MTPAHRNDPQPIQCAACGAALPDDTPSVCPACGADLTAADSVMLRPAPGPGTRLIAWVALAMVAAMLVVALWLAIRSVAKSRSSVTDIAPPRRIHDSTPGANGV